MLWPFLEMDGIIEKTLQYVVSKYLEFNLQLVVGSYGWCRVFNISKSRILKEIFGYWRGGKLTLGRCKELVHVVDLNGAGLEGEYVAIKHTDLDSPIPLGC